MWRSNPHDVTGQDRLNAFLVLTEMRQGLKTAHFLIGRWTGELFNDRLNRVWTVVVHVETIIDDCWKSDWILLMWLCLALLEFSHLLDVFINAQRTRITWKCDYLQVYKLFDVYRRNLKTESSLEKRKYFNSRCAVP